MVICLDRVQILPVVETITSDTFSEVVSGPKPPMWNRDGRRHHTLVVQVEVSNCPKRFCCQIFPCFFIQQLHPKGLELQESPLTKSDHPIRKTGIP